MNKIELLEHLYEEHKCSNCANEIMCDNPNGVCGKWEPYENDRFAQIIERAQANIRKNTKRGEINWIA